MISPQDYQLFQAYLEKTCGIVLSDNKQYLVSSRLNKLLAQENLQTVGDLLKALNQPASHSLKAKVIDAMTTNETLWFRDTYPFTILQNEIFPAAAKANRYDIKIWSAACSSGQEPYSISICAEEYKFQTGKDLNVKIMATDISPAILQSARNAEYDAFSVGRGLSEERRKRFFIELNGLTKVKPEITRRVDFRLLNLLESFNGLPRFDIIFCRNVLIYFSQDVKKDIVNRMADCLVPGGYLFLGASETVSQLSDRFDMQRLHSGVVFKRK